MTDRKDGRPAVTDKPAILRHTPTPWTISPQIERDPSIWIYGNVHPNRPRIAKVEFGLNYGQDVPKETLANAEFIVTACNSYEAMKAALERAASRFDKVVGEAHCADLVGLERDARQWAQETREVLNQTGATKI